MTSRRSLLTNDDPLQELVCQERDQDCLALLCPQGWTYSTEEDTCKLPQGGQN